MPKQLAIQATKEKLFLALYDIHSLQASGQALIKLQHWWVIQIQI